MAISLQLLWVKQWFNQPPLTGNGKFIPPIYIVLPSGKLTACELEKHSLSLVR